MTRKSKPRRVWIPLPPRGLRPKLSPDQKTDLALVHLSTLDALVHGLGTVQVMEELAAAALTWSRVAALLLDRNPDYAPAAESMNEALQAATTMAERYRKTGRVGLTGLEYQTLKQCIEVMDALAEEVDLPTAKAAAQWSEDRMQRMLGRSAGCPL